MSLHAAAVKDSVHALFQGYRKAAEGLDIYGMTGQEVAARIDSAEERTLADFMAGGKTAQDVREHADSTYFSLGELHHGPGRQIKFAVEKVCQPGDVAYDIACGYSTATASALRKAAGRSKTFLVDPTSLRYKGYPKKFAKYGNLVPSYVESFRLESGGLVTDVIGDDGLMHRKALPQADCAFMHNVLPFIDTGDCMWNKSVYKRGYLGARDFFAGVRNIVKDGGKFVVLDGREAVEERMPLIGEHFRLDYRTDLQASLFSDADRNNVFSMYVFV